MIEIPGYSILRTLGHGGMAVVHLAVQHSLGRQVALKILSPALAQDPIAKERFLREARVAASLHHPNIVAVHDVGTHDGLAYMAIAYEPGGSLAERVGEPMAPERALRVLRDIASALDHAHRRGVVHRDVKPHNVLMRDDGACVLSDFGIALAAEPHARLTDRGVSVGTPQYMSPEQLQGGEIDGRSDLYSLGVVLYELLTGRLPYQGPDVWSIGMQHISSPIPRLPDTASELQPLLDALMAKNPDARPATGEDVIRRIESQRPAATTPGSSATAGAAPPTPHAATTPNPAATTPSPAAATPSPAATPSVSHQGATRPRVRTNRIAATVAALVATGLLGWAGFAAFSPDGRGLREPESAPPAAARSEGGTTPATRPDSRDATPATAPNPASIAVLPFVDMSQSRDQAYFSDGIAEELIGVLARIPGLEVAGRTSAFSFRDQAIDLRTIGRKLGVANILEGSVRKSGDRVRISVQLVSAERGFHVWSQTYDRELTDVFAVQDEIAAAVAAALKVELLPPPTPPPRPIFGRDFKSEYAHGLDAFEQGRWEELRARMTAAIAIEPQPAPRMRLYGRRFEPYVPRLYLGLAAHALGDCRVAVESYEDAPTKQMLEHPVVAALLPNEIRLLAAAATACAAAP